MGHKKRNISQNHFINAGYGKDTSFKWRGNNISDGIAQLIHTFIGYPVRMANLDLIREIRSLDDLKAILCPPKPPISQ